MGRVHLRHYDPKLIIFQTASSSIDCSRAAKIIIVALIIGLASPKIGLTEGDISVASQSETAVIVEFMPTNWNIIPHRTPNGEYYHIQFDHCHYNRSMGEPLIPERVVILAVPEQAVASAQLLQADEQRTLDGKILPCPGSLGKLDTAVQFLEANAIYQSSALYPQQLIDMITPAQLGARSVVVLKFFPVQFHPDRDQIVLFKRIAVRINFSLQPSAQPPDKKGRSGIANRLLINPDTKIHPTPAILPKSKGNDRPQMVEFYKIWVREEGIYQIRGTDLQQLGIDLRTIRPDQIKIYNNGGEVLPRALDLHRANRLIENAIWVDDGNDGRFDPHDLILFYGKAVNGWNYDSQTRTFSHHLHPYCLDNVYWLSWQSPEPGRRMRQAAIDSLGGNITIDSFRDLHFIEDEQQNILNSGMLWLGTAFSADVIERSFIFNLANALDEQEILLKINLAGVSGGEQHFSAYFNNELITQFPPFYSSGAQYLNISLQQFAHRFRARVRDGYNQLMLRYHPKSSTSLAYLDWVELMVQRKLKAMNDQLIFYGPDSSGSYKYLLDSFASGDIQVYDVTEFSDVKRVQAFRLGGGAAYFYDANANGLPKRYVAVTPSAYKSPSKIERDLSSNWRDSTHIADFIIICHDDFYDAGLALKSLRENCDSLVTAVVKISDVYDEFAWGLSDPTAIRDFIRYAYLHWQVPPHYVLLLGDGDFDYKNRLSPHAPNWIPAFETEDLRELASRTRDDWYVCVDGNDDLMDLAIGRLPVRNPDEAMGVVQKIINYENSPPIGEWCNAITLVADDEFGAGGQYDPIEHIPDMEGIAKQLIPTRYEIRKIYLTEYPSSEGAVVSGLRKPAARNELLQQINSGNLIINFIGHGNEQVWTHERVLSSANDLSSIENDGRQAVWIAATCNFARFDHPLSQSFAERLLVMPRGGAIAVISTARLAEPFANVSLNRALYRFLFDQSLKPVRLGDVLMLAKNSTGNGPNDQLFHLLGDPTLRVIMPQCEVFIQDLHPDSMVALSKMTVNGAVPFETDTTMVFQGRIVLKAFDAVREREYRVNQWKTYQYVLPGNVLFRGEASLIRGQFTSQFIVPKDISYGAKTGRLSINYFSDDRFGASAVDSIAISGSYVELNDREGPEIHIGFEGLNFLPSGFVPPEPILIITLRDSLSGVNIAGDLGHRIVLTCDNDEANSIDLTDFFQYDRDSYQAGQIRYPMMRLAEGPHQVRVKAWDNCNNSSIAVADFVVVANERLVLRDVLNYPNPFSHSTEFTFWVSQDCEVAIKIYTVTGRLIAKLDRFPAQMGFNHFYWDGRDEDGDPLANGVYIYKLTAKTSHNGQLLLAEQIQKCVLMR